MKESFNFRFDKGHGLIVSTIGICFTRVVSGNFKWHARVILTFN